MAEEKSGIRFTAQLALKTERIMFPPYGLDWPREETTRLCRTLQLIFELLPTSDPVPYDSIRHSPGFGILPQIVDAYRSGKCTRHDLCI